MLDFYLQGTYNHLTFIHSVIIGFLAGASSICQVCQHFSKNVLSFDIMVKILLTKII